MEGKVRAVLERTVLPRYMTRQRWFGAKSRTLETVSIRDWVDPRRPSPSRRSSSASGPTSTTATPTSTPCRWPSPPASQPRRCSGTARGRARRTSRARRARGSSTTPIARRLLRRLLDADRRRRGGQDPDRPAPRACRRRPTTAIAATADSPARSAAGRPSRATRHSSSATSSCSSSSAGSSRA